MDQCCKGPYHCLRAPPSKSHLQTAPPSRFPGTRRQTPGCPDCAQMCSQSSATAQLYHCMPLLRHLAHRLLASLSYATKTRVEKVCENLFHQNKVEPCLKYGITKDFQEILINSPRTRELTIHRSHWDLFAFLSTEDFHKKNNFT